MIDVRFDQFYRYDDLTRLVQAFAEEYPNLVRVKSIGKSHEGRDIWVVTVTNVATGPDSEKPALWVDGNIHATEVSPSTACLCCSTRWSVATAPTPTSPAASIPAPSTSARVSIPMARSGRWPTRRKIIRSTTRPYPYDEEPIGGLVEEDIDGDGRILSMRIPDPNGAWKVCPEEPRLLVRRDPAESGGQYYRLLPEGRIDDYDGVEITIQPKKERPRPEPQLPGPLAPGERAARRGPSTPPRSRRCARWCFHRRPPEYHGRRRLPHLSGVLLRPYGHQSDEKFPAEDLWTYQKIGEKGTEITGYPAISVFHEFRYHPKEVITGAFDDWLYDHLGVFGWTVELWSPQRQAGITTTNISTGSASIRPRTT